MINCKQVVIWIIYIKPTPDGGFTAVQRAGRLSRYARAENRCRIAGAWFSWPPMTDSLRGGSSPSVLP
jgi:hypothetical protein